MGVQFAGRAGFDDTLDELALLAESAGDEPVARVIARRKAPDPALFVGSGKADEIKALVLGHQAEAVLFDQALSPAQQRNLERHLGVAVADRTMLILEIFGARAQSHEGKLQVELARLQYLATRLVRRWSHLERQRGGIGGRGGPGEAQIELDRRMIDERIKSVKQRLLRVKKQRSTQRRARERNQTFRISLVGYTNAGKSTLFNLLVKAQAYAADQLFATLDTHDPPAASRRAGPLGVPVRYGRLHPRTAAQAGRGLRGHAAGNRRCRPVAARRRCGEHHTGSSRSPKCSACCARSAPRQVPQLLVFNKADRLDPSEVPRERCDLFEIEAGLRVPRVFISAASGRQARRTAPADRLRRGW